MDQPVSRSLDWQGAYDADVTEMSPKSMANAWGLIRTVCSKECGVELPEVVTKVPDRQDKGRRVRPLYPHRHP